MSAPWSDPEHDVLADLVAAMKDPDLLAQTQADLDTLTSDIGQYGFGTVPLPDGSTVTIDYTAPLRRETTVSMPNNAPAPSRNPTAGPAMPNELDKLVAVLSALDDATERLRSHIDPILRPSQPEAPPLDPAEVETPLSSVVAAVREARQHAERLLHRVESTIARVDV